MHVVKATVAQATRTLYGEVVPSQTAVSGVHEKHVAVRVVPATRAGVQHERIREGRGVGRIQVDGRRLARAGLGEVKTPSALATSC